MSSTTPSDEHPRPLRGRVALVTGVSRQLGIGRTIADRLRDLGAVVHASGWPAHDAEMPWGADDIPGVGIDQRDLAEPLQPAALVDEVVARQGRLDIIVAVHARSSAHDLASTTADELDRCWAVNVRSIVLLAQRFAHHRRQRGGPGGRMIWFTSGQHLQPMPDEMPYAITKGALEAMTPTLAAALADAGIAATCINPGPVDTGYADPARHSAVERMFPSGRWGTPADVANLVEFLVCDQGAWIQGQVLNSEGGFRRSR
jgi:3-oxoacyl-[acyl-carrier protein] reductase